MGDPRKNGPGAALGATALMLLLLPVAPPHAVASERGSASRRGESEAFSSIAELEVAIEAAVRGDEPDVDALWRRVRAAGRMPLVFGSTAVFLYRGEAETVEWRGDFSSREASWDTRGERLGETDLWRKTVQLLPGSRLDYKIVVDGSDWKLDPLNPFQQLGGYGPNSEARMPGWKPSDLVIRTEGTPRGSFSEDIPFASERLGYTVNYRVYTPPGLDESATGLPVLYVTDGSDYWHDEMGSLVIILDNLYARERIRPLVAVFIDPWDRQANVNRREQELVPAGWGDCAFCDFLIEELIPEIDAAYPTDRSPAGRAILGTSLGGVHTTYMGLAHADRFGATVIQSPALFVADWLLKRLAAAESFASRAFVDAGLYERWFLPEARRLAKRLRELDVDLEVLEVHDGHSWGHWRTTLDDALLFLYPPSPPSPDRPEP